MTKVDRPSLERIANSLDTASNELDAVSESIPDLDGGAATPELAKIMAKLTQDAASMVLGMRATAIAVREANRQYATTDASTADQYVNAWKTN